MNHEMFRDIRSARREGGIGAAVGESGTIPRYVILLPISNFSHVYSFLTVRFPSISRKVPSYLGQCKGFIQNETSFSFVRDRKETPLK